MFCVIDITIKNWCFLLKEMLTKKMCDTNKNVRKMGMIINGVYYTFSGLVVN
jgi:hypothetical protein